MSVMGERCPEHVHCALSEAIIASLIDSGVLKAEQVECLDETSQATLRRIVLSSCCGPHSRATTHSSIAQPDKQQAARDQK